MVVLLLACTGPVAEPKPDTGSPPAEVTAVLPGDVPDTAPPIETGDSTPDPVDTGPFEDLDGDGYDAVAIGGDDCDDDNAWVHPGAVEYCDGVDQDCDGEALAAGSCSLVGPIDAMGQLLTEDPIGWTYDITTIGDITGDGVDDVRLESPEGDTWVTWLYEGGPGLADRMMAKDYWYKISPGNSYYNGLERWGDANGDGYEDIGVTDSWDALTFVVYGPFEEGGVGHGSALDTWEYFDYEWYGDLDLAGADLDGDGNDDFVITSYATGEGYGMLFHYMVGFGDEVDTPCYTRRRAEPFTPQAEPALLGDGDGDGLSELHAGEAVVLGSDMRLLCDAYLEDIAVGSTIEAQDEAFYYLDFAQPLLDWTGDGYDEFAVFDLESDGITALRFFDTSAALDGELDYDAAIGSLKLGLSSDYDCSDHKLRVDDLDGDGVQEIYGKCGGTGLIMHFDGVPPPSSDYPESAVEIDLYSVDQDTLSTGGSLGNFCSRGACSDVTGDGVVDYFLSATRTGPDGVGSNIKMIEGFPIPWDDPTYW